VGKATLLAHQAEGLCPTAGGHINRSASHIHRQVPQRNARLVGMRQQRSIEVGGPLPAIRK
jgi:hypothetical protein